ncbi:MAG: hypothetical protein AAFX51_14440 [Cyanobacteria bacterium J06636_28]
MRCPTIDLLDLLDPASGDADRLRGCAVTEFAQQGKFDRALELAQPMRMQTIGLM